MPVRTVLSLWLCLAVLLGLLLPGVSAQAGTAPTAPSNLTL